MRAEVKRIRWDVVDRKIAKDKKIDLGDRPIVKGKLGTAAWAITGFAAALVVAISRRLPPNPDRSPDAKTITIWIGRGATAMYPGEAKSPQCRQGPPSGSLGPSQFRIGISAPEAWYCGRVRFTDFGASLAAPMLL